jgi:predicted glycogen debranching enzyme
VRRVLQAGEKAGLSDGAPHPIEFGRSICGDLAAAERREWLVTNGLGGYASGTIAGTVTRRYHGLLVAVLHSLQRTLLVTKIDETARYRGAGYALGANRWKDDYVAPRGFELIERFYLDGIVPVWEYAFSDALIEKRVWMKDGANVTYVRYSVLRAVAPVELRLRAFVNYRDFHGNTHAGDWPIGVGARSGGVDILAYDGAVPFALVADRGSVAIESVWYRDYVLVRETERGLDDRDDNLGACTFTVSLAPGENVTLTMGVGAVDASGVAGGSSGAFGGGRGAAAVTADDVTVDGVVRQLELAAAQFIIRRPIRYVGDGYSIIAGYHWFGDWGRDTAIALPGLTLATGRNDVAKNILMNLASSVDGGMLPNIFPTDDETPAYNTVDAALWYVEAVAAYIDATGDREVLRAVWPALRQIFASYRAGTRYGIRMDSDGLITAGAPGVQLTWMDAKIGDWVVTPRMGKPVEIAALWYKALKRLAKLAPLAGELPDEYAVIAERARTGFARFWNDTAGYCYDVIDGPDGNDATLRPNQIFAVSLPHSPLSPERGRAVVDACAAQLLTTNGLRTLPQSDPRFAATYGGSQRDRDAAYHQGTVWPWLLGPFAIAYARVYGDVATARALLDRLADQTTDYGLGSISELADATPPFAPRGAIAQAWSVAELLRAWKQVGSNS